MQKKLIFLITLIMFFNSSLNELHSGEIKILPLKKPTLSDQELKKKVLVNLLKPLAKPKKIIKETKLKIKVKEKKYKYLTPQKKPQLQVLLLVKKVDKSKYYRKKDFVIAKKAISEMKKSNWVVALQTAKKQRINLFIILYNGNTC